MKKHVFIASVLLAITNFVMAQGSSGYGIKSGLIFSKLNVEDVSDGSESEFGLDEVRLSPSIGFFFNLFQNDNFIFQTEVSYFQKGGERTDTIRTSVVPNENDKEVVTDLNYDYVSLGLAALPRFSNNNFTAYGIIGLGYDFMLKARSAPISKSEHTTTNWSYTVGLGMSSKRIFDDRVAIEIGYNSDFKEFYENENVKFSNSLFFARTAISLN